MSRRRWILVGALAMALASATVALALLGDGGTVQAERRTTTSAPSSSSGGVTSTTTAPPTTAPTTSAAPTTTAPPVTTAPPATGTTAPPPPPFRSATSAVTADQLGASWREGCPVGPDRLRAIDLTHWGFDGAIRTGRIIVHADQVTRVVAAFRDIYAARFPIERMRPIDAYGGDDEASMRDDNTSGFNCRYVSGTTRWSEHAFGRAIDINPLRNPYVRGSSVDPPEGAAYADRTRTDPGMIHAGDPVVRAFAAQGWGWGGSWSGGKDYQHVSASGR